MNLERILKRMVKGLFPWRHQGSGTNYHSRSGFHHQRQFLRLILRLIFLSVHLICRLICSFYFMFVTLLYYIVYLTLRILILTVLECIVERYGQLMEDGAI